MFTVESVTNPIFGNAEGTAIYASVKFAEFNEAHPFTATTWDSEEHGRLLHARILSGEFGPIGAYVPPAETPSPEATMPQPVVTGAQTL